MSRIAKTSRRAREVLSRAQEVRVYSLGNYFCGEPSSVVAARRDLETFPFAKLLDNGDGSFTVHVHSNLWYELKLEVAP